MAIVYAQHTRHPENYLQTCSLCCQYLNACEGEPGARYFWEEQLEYLHSVADKVSIIKTPDAHAGFFEVQVNDMAWIDSIYNTLDAIYPEEISTSVHKNIITCYIYEPDILWLCE